MGRPVSAYVNILASEASPTYVFMTEFGASILPRVTATIENEEVYLYTQAHTYIPRMPPTSYINCPKAKHRG